MYIDYVKKFITNSRKGRVESVVSHGTSTEILAVDAGGSHLVVKLIGSRVPIRDVNTEITHEAHECEAVNADYVYIAVPSKKLIYVSKRTREILLEKQVGLLEISSGGEIVEVIPPGKRVLTAPQPNRPMEAAQRLQPPTPIVVYGASETVESRDEEPGGRVVEAEEGIAEGDVPDFIKGNPWLNVLGRRRKGGG